MSRTDTKTIPRPNISSEMQSILDRSGMELVLSEPLALGSNETEREWLVVPVDRHERHRERLKLLNTIRTLKKQVGSNP